MRETAPGMDRAWESQPWVFYWTAVEGRALLTRKSWIIRIRENKKGHRVEWERQNHHGKNTLKMWSQEKQELTECGMWLLVQRGDLVSNTGHVARFAVNALGWLGQNKHTSFRSLHGLHQCGSWDIMNLGQAHQSFSSTVCLILPRIKHIN